MHQQNWELEQREWVQSLESVVREHGPQSAQDLLVRLQDTLTRKGVHDVGNPCNTPYRNTIDQYSERPYPGDIEIERRIENILRWNAAAMVLQAYDSGTGVGGHIGTYFSASTLMEVVFNHFLRKNEGDQIHVQAHASPGLYARAWLEGRLSTEQLTNFRRELQPGGGLPSYPHPRRLPDFWEMPTASMGLSTPCAIYQARFTKYLEHRGLIPASNAKIWLFVGDGETDEPEVLGTLNIAAREKLDNLIIVVNCNFQRLDGPVRGNGKIIQELEGSFRGAGWNVIKVIWGTAWDRLFAGDTNGFLLQRLEQMVDGDFQLLSASTGEDIRKQLVGDDSRVKELLEEFPNTDLEQLTRGGHDYAKIYNAFQAASSSSGKPCVVLAKTVKGEGMGQSSQAKNTIHQKKQLTPDERHELARNLKIPLSEEEVHSAKFYRPDDDSVEVRYLCDRRDQLGGFLPERNSACPSLDIPSLDFFQDMLSGTGERAISTTMSLMRMLQRMLRHKEIGKYIVPIVPDEARTFGMDGLFAQVGIYDPAGQQYTPVDAGTIAPYKESRDGQILQEGICESGALASFLAAGTAYATHSLPMIPIYFFYSIFGFQRVGDLIWACGDMLCRGFLVGATSGRTTLNGEGVQHQDGHSLLVATTIPNLVSYDPAFSFEIAVIMQSGLTRMYRRQENVFYYITATNQNYPMPAMPADVTDGIIAGMYAFNYTEDADINLLGSGAIMTEVLKAADILRSMNQSVSVWSVTSYSELHREALHIERKRRLTKDNDQTRPYIEELLEYESGIFVAATDYQKALPTLIAPWVPNRFTVLGTDGYGLSESREDLRNYFEVSAEWIVFAALSTLPTSKRNSTEVAYEYARSAGLDLQKSPPT